MPPPAALHLSAEIGVEAGQPHPYPRPYKQPRLAISLTGSGRQSLLLAFSPSRLLSVSRSLALSSLSSVHLFSDLISLHRTRGKETFSIYLPGVFWDVSFTPDLSHKRAPGFCAVRCVPCGGMCCLEQSTAPEPFINTSSFLSKAPLCVCVCVCALVTFPDFFPMSEQAVDVKSVFKAFF